MRQKQQLPGVKVISPAHNRKKDTGVLSNHNRLAKAHTESLVLFCKFGIFVKSDHP
jgi:hypothetical protein